MKKSIILSAVIFFAYFVTMYFFNKDLQAYESSDFEDYAVESYTTKSAPLFTVENRLK